MLSLISAASLTLLTLSPAVTVDLARYQGTWYEIASKPQAFQQGCTCTEAEYQIDNSAQVEPTDRARVSEFGFRAADFITTSSCSKQPTHCVGDATSATTCR